LEDLLAELLDRCDFRRLQVFKWQASSLKIPSVELGVACIFIYSMHLLKSKILAFIGYQTFLLY
jgi:hypothetical protein